jgi:hypothetical protein
MIVRRDEVYVVRIWLASTSAGTAWRATATDVRSHERHTFGSPEALARFLGLARVPEVVPDDTESDRTS